MQSAAAQTAGNAATFCPRQPSGGVGNNNQFATGRGDIEFKTRITLCISYKRKLVNRPLVYGGITADWRLLNISRVKWRLLVTGWLHWRSMNTSGMKRRLLYTGWPDWRLSWFYHALPMNTGTTHPKTDFTRCSD
jgi:hypothetical protein